VLSIIIFLLILRAILYVLVNHRAIGRQKISSSGKFGHAQIFFKFSEYFYLSHRSMINQMEQYRINIYQEDKGMAEVLSQEEIDRLLTAVSPLR
jgi:hypothetical protein